MAGKSSAEPPEELARLRDQRVGDAYTLLLLVEYPGEAVTLAEVHTWTDGQVLDVTRWAAAVHMAASDNYPPPRRWLRALRPAGASWTTGGHVPPMPAVLSER